MQTPSDFDYKPRRKSSILDTQYQSTDDQNSTFNSTTNASVMNKTASSANMKNNARNDDKEEDWFFRSVNRAKRDQVLDVKEDFKKQRAQSTHILLTKRAWRTACHKEAWLQAYSRVRAGRRCQCRACRWNGSTTLEGQISLRLVGQISTPQARALVLAWSALRACHRRSSHHFDLLVRRRCRGQS